MPRSVSANFVLCRLEYSVSFRFVQTFSSARSIIILKKIEQEHEKWNLWIRGLTQMLTTDSTAELVFSTAAGVAHPA